MTEKIELKTETDFENYTGNIRIAAIDFDTLHQMWEGSPDEYDPDTDDAPAKFYIGKVGKYEKGSFLHNSQLNCDCLCVRFENDYLVMVTPYCVDAVDERMTPVEYLPDVTPKKKDLVFESLNNEEMEFSDKVVLKLLDGSDSVSEMKEKLDLAITLAIYRTHMYHNSRWDKSL